MGKPNRPNRDTRSSSNLDVVAHQDVPDILETDLPVLACPGAPHWMQVNCALFHDEGGRRLYFPWGDLAATVETWREDCRFVQWFFMRKPPGLRLRFYGPELERRLVPVVVPWLEQAEHRNAIRGFRASIYEPEEFRFGGTEGMDIAHDQFDNDSCLALRYETLASDDQVALPREMFSFVVMHDLFRRCVADSAEVWDVWQRLRHALGLSQQQPIEIAKLGPERSLPVRGSDLMKALSPDGATLLSDAFAQNRGTAARLHAAQMFNRMTIGPRAWLVALCIFHWNRLGLTLNDIGPLVERVVHQLDPARESELDQMQP